MSHASCTIACSLACGIGWRGRRVSCWPMYAGFGVMMERTDEEDIVVDVLFVEFDVKSELM